MPPLHKHSLKSRRLGMVNGRLSYRFKHFYPGSSGPVDVHPIKKGGRAVFAPMKDYSHGPVVPQLHQAPIVKGAGREHKKAAEPSDIINALEHRLSQWGKKK